MKKLVFLGVFALGVFATSSALAESNDWTIENKTTDYKFVFTRVSISCASGDHVLTQSPLMPGEKRTVSMYRQQSGICWAKRSGWQVKVVAQRLRPADDPTLNELELPPFVDPDFPSYSLDYGTDRPTHPRLQKTGPIEWHSVMRHPANHPHQDSDGWFIQHPTVDGVDYENLAWGKPVRQSSTALGAGAERAVDRNWDGRWTTGSVTHTNDEPAPWWEVDLAGQFDVVSLEIQNRTDCCADRLANFMVQVSPTAIDANTPIAARNTNLTQALYKLPINTRGRYVRITRTTPGPLSLAEVKVVGVMNYARGKAVRQSTTALGGDAARATDGVIDGKWSNGKVTHTGDYSTGDNARWIEVDLGAPMPINSVRLYHRTDCCTVQPRIWISNTPAPNDGMAWSHVDRQNQVWAYDTALRSAIPPVETFFTNGVIGRYVRIGHADEKAISLTEIEVYTQAFSPARNESHYCLRTGNDQNFVGQGLQAAASATGCGRAESFTIVDVDGGKLLAGDTVYLMTYHHRHVSARDNGEVWARMPARDHWERFAIWTQPDAEKSVKGAEIKANAKVAFRGWNGWLKAVNAGGTVVKTMDDAPPQQWGTFTLVPTPY